MKEYLIDTIEYKGNIIKLYQDPDPINPREDDNLGKMVCSHRRYELGDEQFNKNRIDYYSSFDELFADYINLKYGIVETQEYDSVLNEKEIEKVWKWINKNILYAPLYMYEHSNIRIKIGSFYGLLPQGHAEFDSGQIGFIYVDKERLLKEYKAKSKRLTKKIRKTAMKVLEGEVEEYDYWGSGQVYGFVAETEEGENIDSCWGFFGDTNYAIKEAKNNIDYYIKNKIEKHNKKLKSQIKKKVELTYREPLKV